MTDFQPGQPGSSYLYNGFSGAGPAAPPARRGRRRMVYAGIGVALAGGLAFGLLARPAERSEAVREREARGVPVELVAPPPAAMPVAAGKLEVLPPGAMATSMPPPAIVATGEPPVLRPPREVEHEPVDEGVLRPPPDLVEEAEEPPLEDEPLDEGPPEGFPGG